MEMFVLSYGPPMRIDKVDTNFLKHMTETSICRWDDNYKDWWGPLYIDRLYLTSDDARKAWLGIKVNTYTLDALPSSTS